MGKSVAICGFSTITLPPVKNSKADEIWTLNHAFVMEWAFPRFDRVFELHAQDWFLRAGEEKLRRYEEWLRQKHPFPIYMQQAFPEYPSSVKYPLDEVNLDIFGKLLRGGKINLYYTSSFSYMIALAIYERVERIEIYGIDMANDTEYTYQKPGGEFMIGVAIGRGIEVDLLPESQLCIAQLYAYDKVPSASRQRAIELMEYFREKEKFYREEAKQYAQAYQDGDAQAADKYMNAIAFVAMNAGGALALQQLLEHHDYYFGRQPLEDRRHYYYTYEEEWLAILNEKHAIFKLRQAEGKNIESAWKEVFEARWKMYSYSGAKQAFQKLIDECDMKVVPNDMRLEIIDDTARVVSASPS